MGGDDPALLALCVFGARRIERIELQQQSPVRL